MKKLSTLLLFLIMCLSLASCSNTVIDGELSTYCNTESSFSVELPTKDEKSWTADEGFFGDMLSLTHSTGAFNIRIHGISKNKIRHIAPDLDAFEDYAVINTFAPVLSSAQFEDTTVQVPEFITGSTAKTFHAGEAEGTVIFMESERCYYAYIITSTTEAYSANKKELLESVLTLKETADSTSVNL